MAGPPIISFLEWLANLTRSENFIRKLQVRAADSAKKRLLSGPLRRFDLQHRDAKAEKAFGKQREKGLNLNQLLRSCPSKIQSNAVRDEVTIKSLRRNRDKTRLTSRSLTYDRTKGNLIVRPHQHWCEIIPSSGEMHNVSFAKAKRLKVRCDCEWFKFHCEYALAKRYGAADTPDFSNGMFPIETNPGLAAQICKHLYVQLTYIKQRNL